MRGTRPGLGSPDWKQRPPPSHGQRQSEWPGPSGFSTGRLHATDARGGPLHFTSVTAVLMPPTVPWGGRGPQVGGGHWGSIHSKPQKAAAGLSNFLTEQAAVTAVATLMATRSAWSAAAVQASPCLPGWLSIAWPPVGVRRRVPDHPHLRDQPSAARPPGLGRVRSVGWNQGHSWL